VKSQQKESVDPAVNAERKQADRPQPAPVDAGLPKICKKRKNRGGELGIGQNSTAREQKEKATPEKTAGSRWRANVKSRKKQWKSHATAWWPMHKKREGTDLGHPGNRHSTYKLNKTGDKNTKISDEYAAKVCGWDCKYC